jgi:hypothetical protein
LASGWGGTIPDDSGLGAQAGWMRDYVTMCTYVAVELGFEEIRPLAAWVAYQTIAIATGPRPKFIAQYIFPDVKVDQSYYQSLDEIFDGWAYMGNIPLSDGGFPAAGTPNTFGVTSEAYGSIAATAIAMSNSAANQDAAWAFVEQYHRLAPFYNHDPRYAIIPRGNF